MEKKINLEPGTHYQLPQEELKKMYIHLALFKYNYLRVPDYNEKILLELLKADFKNFLIYIQSLMEQMPNNHSLHKILVFFGNHYDNLKRIVEGLEKDA